jgi:hypothetical protein
MAESKFDIHRRGFEAGLSGAVDAIGEFLDSRREMARRRGVRLGEASAPWPVESRVAGTRVGRVPWANRFFRRGSRLSPA